MPFRRLWHALSVILLRISSEVGATGLTGPLAMGSWASLWGSCPIWRLNIDEGIFKPVHAIIYAVACVIGNALAFGVITPILTTLFYGGELEITFTPGDGSRAINTLVLVIIGIPILILLARRNARGTGPETRREGSKGRAEYLK